MDQHPVPQNISSYEFRLVGDMTLKQFFQLAGGVGVGFLFTRMPLPFFLKWPLAGISVLVGIMMAFVPVNGRPFSQWIVAFIKAVYSPTEFAWQSTMSQPLEAPPAAAIVQSTKHSALDMLESQIFSRVTNLFNSSAAVPPVATVAPPPPMTVVEEKPVVVQAPVAPVVVAPAPVLPTEPRKPIMVAEIVENSSTQTPNTQAAPATPTVSPIYQSIPTPQMTPMVPHSPAPPAQPAVHATHLSLPERPNIISGQIVNLAGLGIEGVIVEVSDSNTGIPVRALKTNKLGQFQSASPISNGPYTITVEKEGVSFDPVSIVAAGSIINPVLITSKT